MHLRASRTLWLPGGPAAHRPPAPMAMCHSQLCTPRKGKKVNCFLKTGRIFIWNNSFRAQIKLRMHLRASRTLWLLGDPDPPPQWQCAIVSPAHQKRVKNGKLFSLNRTNFIIWNHSFGPQIRVIMHLWASTTLSLLAVPTPQGVSQDPSYLSFGQVVS